MFLRLRDLSKKNRTEILFKMTCLPAPHLCSRYDSSRIMFLHFSAFLEGADDTTRDTETPARFQVPAPSHPGIKYRVRTSPHFDNYKCQSYHK